jgi:hypothetical protein
MTTKMNEKSQPVRILRYLQEHMNEWVNGQYFLRTMYFSQFHHKIWCLQHQRDKYIYEGTIEASDFRDTWGFKSYRLVIQLDHDPDKQENQRVPETALPPARLPLERPKAIAFPQGEDTPSQYRPEAQPVRVQANEQGKDGQQISFRTPSLGEDKGNTAELSGCTDEQLEGRRNVTHEITPRICEVPDVAHESVPQRSMAMHEVREKGWLGQKEKEVREASRRPHQAFRLFPETPIPAFEWSNAVRGMPSKDRHLRRQGAAIV